MFKLNKVTLLSGCLAAALIGSVQASALPDSFFGAAAQSPAVNYQVLDAVLRTSVMAEGMPSRDTVLTRDRFANKEDRRVPLLDKYTALAANRFHFEEYRHNPEMREVVAQLRAKLSALPDQTPLNSLTKPEQLAYWLNLYNVTVLDEVIKVYPHKDLQDLMLGDTEQSGLLDQKILQVAGVRLSLNDIQFSILPRQFPNQPEVLYGLYQGFIGSPNIANQAYTGENVQVLLRKNATEFINSNRGTLITGLNGFRVSSFYQRSAAYFPNFQQDLRQHLATYLRKDEQADLANAKTLVADLSNFDVTDIYGTAKFVSSDRTAVKVAILPLGKAEARRLTQSQLAQYHLLKQRGQQLNAESTTPEQKEAVEKQPAAAI